MPWIKNPSGRVVEVPDGHPFLDLLDDPDSGWSKASAPKAEKPTAEPKSKGS